MKVLLTHRPGGAYGYISDGWLNALAAGGHTVRRWDGQRATWDNFGPDLYIGCSGHRQPIPANRGNTKVAIHVNPYCGTNIDGINENINAINWTISQNPTVVFGYGSDNDRQYWSHWTDKHAIPWVPMPTAGDSVIYRDLGSERPYDIGYVGGYWLYKAINIDKYLLPVLRDKSLRSSVHGWGDWPPDVCQSGVADDGVVTVLNEVKVGPCVTEPHTTAWGIDVPERLWKVALCGALVVHDSVKNLESLMPTVVMAANPTEYHGICKYYCDDKNVLERQRIAQSQKAHVLSNHTYFQRMARLFKEIGAVCGDGEFTAEAEKLSKLS